MNEKNVYFEFNNELNNLFALFNAWMYNHNYRPGLLGCDGNDDV